jgi:hypothetical protein
MVDKVKALNAMVAEATARADKIKALKARADKIKASNARLAAEATARARAGDWGYLSRLFRHSAVLHLTPDLQRVLADILEGKIRRKTPKKLRAPGRQMHMAYRVEILRFRGWTTEAAVAKVCAEYDMRERTVYAAMKAWPEFRSLKTPEAMQQAVIALQQLVTQAIAANDQRAVKRLQRLIAFASADAPDSLQKNWFFFAADY